MTLSLACGDYDRVRALRDGSVKPEGIELIFLALPPGEIFTRALRYQEFEVCELSFGNYIAGVGRGDAAYVAVPVFPSRFFRHSAAYVHAGAGIGQPEDLRGKRIGIAEYQMTALIWMRGFLELDHGIRPADVTWVVGGLDEPHRLERMTVELPPDIKIERAPDGATLEGMLEQGQIDALFSPKRPRSFGREGASVRRLFPDYRSVEQAQYRRNKIFPIMHVLAIRRDVYAAHPWVAQSLFKAFGEAKRRALEALLDTQTLAVTLPWSLAETEETRALMGDDWWPYGIAPNQATLEHFADQAHRQGITKRRVDVNELFAKETRQS